MSDLEYCRCLCHMVDGISHVEACCQQCEICGQNIAVEAFDQHVKNHDRDLRRNFVPMVISEMMTVGYGKIGDAPWGEGNCWSIFVPSLGKTAHVANLIGENACELLKQQPELAKGVMIELITSEGDWKEVCCIDDARVPKKWLRKTCCRSCIGSNETVTKAKSFLSDARP